MHKTLRLFYSAFFGIIYCLDKYWSFVRVRSIFFILNIKYGKHLTSIGVPNIYISKNAQLKIGNNVKINNKEYSNPIGRSNRCIFSVRGYLEIGNHVGISSSTIVSHHFVKIGNNVKIGGNVVIYDTDFHSLNSKERNSYPENINNVKKSPVIINDGVFIGSHSIILKGVEIGENSIVGAGSVVTKSIPSKEIWAGNPAKFIRKISDF